MFKGLLAASALLYCIHHPVEVLLYVCDIKYEKIMACLQLCFSYNSIFVYIKWVKNSLELSISRVSKLEIILITFELDFSEKNCAYLISNQV